MFERLIQVEKVKVSELWKSESGCNCKVSRIEIKRLWEVDWKKGKFNEEETK